MGDPSFRDQSLDVPKRLPGGKRDTWDGRDMDLFTIADAREARDNAIALHGQRDPGAEYIQRARLHATSICIERGSVTADDVRASCGDPPPQCDGRIMGAIFTPKLFVRVGYRQSKRKINHAKMIAVFELRGEV